jgi:dUTP pyrophosphatase
MTIKIKKLNPNAVIPSYAKHGDAGMDVHATEEVVLKPGEIKLVSTGLAFEIPYGTELQIRPRSGLALKKGVSIVNSPGTLDYGYRGELKIILINHGKENFEVKKEDRIAQIVLNRIEIVDVEEVDELSETERGEGGFGSTGLK